MFDSEAVAEIYGRPSGCQGKVWERPQQTKARGFARRSPRADLAEGTSAGISPCEPAGCWRGVSLQALSKDWVGRKGCGRSCRLCMKAVGWAGQRTQSGSVDKDLPQNSGLRGAACCPETPDLSQAPLFESPQNQPCSGSAAPPWLSL